MGLECEQASVESVVSWSKHACFSVKDCFDLLFDLPQLLCVSAQLFLLAKDEVLVLLSARCFEFCELDCVDSLFFQFL